MRRDHLWAAITLLLAVETAWHAEWQWHPEVLAAILLHLITAVLFLIRAPAAAVDKSVWSAISVPVALGYVYFYRFSDRVSPAESAGEVLLIAGITLCLTATVTLGRRFGVLPANRGVETRGVYSVVRHPVYASYLLIDAGVLCVAPDIRNFALATIGWAAVAVRIWREEAILDRSPEYAAYRRRVRYRILPGLL